VNAFYIGETFRDIGTQCDNAKPDDDDKSDLTELPLDNNPCSTTCSTPPCDSPVATSEPIVCAYDFSVVENVVLALGRLGNAANFVDTMFAGSPDHLWQSLFARFVLDPEEIEYFDPDPKIDRILAPLECLLP